mmetsp:Transcript_10331/g.22797  ORF Transcript_10331/g.22797 Transcript_10331/m.22797 type:complete len:232 (+) Transcript_10331:131-826(+)
MTLHFAESSTAVTQMQEQLGRICQHRRSGCLVTVAVAVSVAMVVIALLLLLTSEDWQGFALHGPVVADCSEVFTSVSGVEHAADVGGVVGLSNVFFFEVEVLLDSRLELLPAQLDGDGVGLLGVVIKERTDVRPEPPGPRHACDGADVEEDVLRSVQEEASQDRIPGVGLRGIDLHELACAHRKFGLRLIPRTEGVTWTDVGDADWAEVVSYSPSVFKTQDEGVDVAHIRS